MREEEKKEREKREKKRKEMETELQQKTQSLEEEKSKLEEANSGGAAKIELLEKKNEEAIQAAASLRQELDDMAVAKLQLSEENVKLKQEREEAEAKSSAKRKELEEENVRLQDRVVSGEETLRSEQDEWAKERRRMVRNFSLFWTILFLVLIDL